jgi:U6 snRNA-associated Sm-like protein LSm1
MCFSWAFAEKLLVILRDGRKLVGTLRSFDQFANVVLERAIERIIVGELYCDLPLGLYIIRGENVVLIGELVSTEQPLCQSTMNRILLSMSRQVQIDLLLC